MIRRSLLLLFALGCGHGENPGPPDIADPPPPPPPPVPGPASVHITNAGVAVPGVTVFFEDSAGVQTVQTDTNGVAAAEVFAGAFVTAVDPFGAPERELRTFAGVFPFDSLELTTGTPAAEPPITVTLAAPVESTAATYAVTTSCGTGTLTRAGTGAPTGQLTLRDCHGRFDVLVETFEANATPRRTLYASNLSVADGATITIPGPYELLQSVPIQVITQQGFSSAAVTLTRRSPNGITLVRQLDIPIDSNSGNGTATVSIPDLVNGIQLVEARTAPRTDDLHRAGVVVVTNVSAASQFLDLFSDPLPRITETPSFFAPRSIVWRESSFKPYTFESAPPPDRDADFSIADLAITRGTTRWHWRISSPHLGTAINLPTLTGDSADLNITSGDTVTVEALSQYGLSGSYDAIRGRTLDTKNPAAFLDLTFGRVVFEELR